MSETVSLTPTITRKGECNNCGWCCQFEGIARNVLLPEPGEAKVNPSDRQFYELRGGKTAPDGSITRYISHCFAPCSAHDTNKQTCKIYAARPTICQEFPSIPEQIEGTPCSYWFELSIGEEVVERRGGTGSPYSTPPMFNQ